MVVFPSLFELQLWWLALACVPTSTGQSFACGATRLSLSVHDRTRQGCALPIFPDIFPSGY